MAKGNDAHRVHWTDVDVGSVKVAVYLVDREKFAEHMRDDDGTPAVGIYVAEMSTILIGWDLPHDLAEQTLLHELSHADEYIAGHAHSERTLNAITACQYSTLKRNGYLRFPPRPVTPEDRRKARAAKKAGTP